MTARPMTLIAIAAVAGIAGIALTSADATLAAAQSQSSEIPEIEWETSLVKFQFDNDKFLGQRFTAKCIPANPKDLDEVVYGTDTYPSNNSICTAALHAGLVDKNGGVVTVQLNPGADGYTGSIRNGIESKDGSSSVRTISFVEGPAQN